MQKAKRSQKNVASKVTSKKATSKQQKRKLSKVVKKSPLTKSKRNVHVAVIGAAGGIGQPLAMLIKQNQNNVFTKLSLYDVNSLVSGVGADLSHIPTSVQVTAHTDLDQALAGADIVVVPAGVPRKPGMTRDDLFNVNAKINFTIASAVAKNCPNACNLIISNPVNSMVPLWSEVLKSKGVYTPTKLFGVTTLDVFRATTFSHDKQPAGNGRAVPVIGGHAGTTIVPLFSMCDVDGSVPEMEALVQRTMFGGDEVVKAKAGGGSATLSMASAGARFAEQVASALKGGDAPEEATAENVDYAFVENPEANKAFGTEFFASGVLLGPTGVKAIQPTWTSASPVEQKLVEAMVGDLKSQIQKGQEWARNELANPSPAAAPVAPPATPKA